MARRVAVGLAGMIVAAAALLPAGQGRAQHGAPAEGVKPDLKAIADCLAAGREIVMTPQPDCVDRQAGDETAEKAGMPLGERDWVRACSNGGDPRRLPRDTVKRLAREADIAPSGIRIVGALFCDGIDLAGVDLPYSLVLDRSVVMGVVDARNLRLKGDFSIEYAVLFGTLRLNRARIEGSVYLGAGFIRRLRAYDTHVTGSWQQKTAIVFLDAHLVRLAVSGDVDLTRSAFSRLWIQSSRIGGTLRLDETEARCAYHVNASTIGYLTANQAGFGKVVTIGAGPDATRYPWWRHAVEGRPATYTQTLFRSAAIAAVAEAERRRIVRPELPAEENALLRGCREEAETLPDGSTRPVGIEGVAGSRYLEFYVFDTTVQAALCLTAFNWGSPRDGEAPDPHHPVTILALNGSKVDGNLILDLWDDESTLQTVRPGHPAFARVAAQHKFEAVGLSAAAAIYDFGDQHRPYITFLDGLRFGRVHKATPACGTDYGTKLASQVELPSVGDVLRWLDKNQAPSSQPFLTFVEAFEKAGADADELRIQRRTVDLCDRVVRWVPWAARLCPGAHGEAAAAAPPAANGAPVQASFGAAVSAVGDLIGTAFSVMLWALADHGLRPGKVVWWLAGVMLLFWLLFRLGLGIVCFAPAEGRPGARLWPVGPLFLFDRLIPLYKICDEHYAIARYYRAAAPDADAGPDPPDGDAREATLRGRRILVRPVDQATAERADRLLVALRIVGVVLTIFLLAALNSLTR
ncbi:hypothetical protein PQJ75_15900 [Rhodoplanes sp. TEM]|uniref:Uncharacterized protein n=1 Tax=Rhodoplanes tepidamans TaxID=200616 RepID=A0ABT5J7E9_RHOTP|nr:MULTISPECIES: hypothetical protein [Rhodoplanes]MDC7785582.1 hypothetical protein [Rhodoplanes tepidamans]MDC7985219.1 hypothetical protein [Rhodoplanes sp. TEM]MDQ0353248.1 hypothetical protein [Rhodoplanes tepidamans]